MKLVSIFVLFLAVFTCDCKSSTDESSEKTNITTGDNGECGNISSNCTTVILSEGDYLYITNDDLFVRPLGLTIDGSSYVNSNGTVAVCECLFYGPKTSEYGSGSCNLTTDNCTKVSLDPMDILYLSDSAVFVKTLNTRLDDSAYEIVNGSMFVCECMIMDKEMDALNNTCSTNVKEIASISTNCSTVTLKPRDYLILSNATVFVLAWNVTLNESFYSVTNGSLTVCTPDCDGVVHLGLQLLWTGLFVYIFEIFWSILYSHFPMVELHKFKFKIVAFFYSMSSLLHLAHFAFYPEGHYDFWVPIFFQLSFSVVVGFGMFTITSSYPVIKLLQWTGIVEVTQIDILPKKRIRMLLFYWFCLITPFVIAYYLKDLSSSRSFATMSVSDYYYTKKFRYYYMPVFYMVQVGEVFYVLNLAFMICSGFYLVHAKLINPRDQQEVRREETYFIYFVYFLLFFFTHLFWKIGCLSLSDDAGKKGLLPTLTVCNLFLSTFIYLLASVIRERIEDREFVSSFVCL